MTSIQKPAPAAIQPPAYRVANRLGDLFRDMGAAEVTPLDSVNVRLSYRDATEAATAKALFKDAMWGASLLVDGPAGGAPSTTGVIDALAGIDRLEVRTVSAGSSTLVLAHTTDRDLAKIMTDLTKPSPMPGTNVQIVLDPPLTFAPGR